MANPSDIQPGVKFRHYKNKDYEIIALATDEATGKKVVVYKMLYGDYSTWVRQLDNFCEMVTVDGEVRERFKVLR